VIAVLIEEGAEGGGTTDVPGQRAVEGIKKKSQQKQEKGQAGIE
jgi:hypothetical protein